MSDAASELAKLRAALAAAEARADVAESELAQTRAVVSCSEAMIQELKLEIAKLRRDKYGISSERRARLIDQLELQLEELETAATEDVLTAGEVAEKASTVRAFTRRHPVRKPFPDHLPRERVVVEAPATCTCCGSDRIVKMGEDITETLEVIPRQWKVIQTVREKFTCRACEKISQPPAPFHAIPRGWAGPSLIAMLVFEKYGQHQPLNRQAERFAREGVELSLSTLADLVGHATVALQPIHALIEAANICDERVSLAGGGTGGSIDTEPRYSCNGVVSLSETPKTIIEAMLTAMAGRCIWQAGTWRIMAGGYRIPSLTLGPDHIREGGLQLTTRMSRAANFNAVRGQFVSPENDWQPDDFPAYSSEVYRLEDGGETVWRDLSLPFTISASMAQRLARIELERARRQMRLRLDGKLSAWAAGVGETVRLD
jgi:transposase